MSDGLIDLLNKAKRRGGYTVVVDGKSRLGYGLIASDFVLVASA